MNKRFIYKVPIINNHLRCHYTRKNGKWKRKRQFKSKKAALSFIAKNKLLGYSVYKCPVCDKWHIGHK